MAGEIVTGELVRLACQRHLADLERAKEKGWRYSLDEADKASEFFALLHHFKGKWARGRCTCRQKGGFEGCPNRFRPEPWQEFIIRSIFGWQKRVGGRWVRRFRTAFKLTARKQGKTFVGGGVGLKLFVGDGEEGAEVYAAATKKDQARIVHDAAKQMVRRSPALARIVKGATAKYTNLYTDDGRKFEALGADADTMDGTNPHGSIVDEYHAHPDAAVRQTLKTGMGAREQPLEFIISTAGLRVEGNPCRALRDYAEKVLRGLVTDDELFAYIAELDEGDDWLDSANYIKANPNLGVSVTLAELESEAKRANEDPEAEIHFRTKRLNQWVGRASGFVSMEDWAACARLPLDLEALRGRECFAGVDLASVSDMSALALAFPPEDGNWGGEWSALLWYWMPEAIRERRERRDQAVRNWIHAGLIETTPGDRTDYEAIRGRIREAGLLYHIREIGYDPWNSGNLPIQLMEDGFEVVTVPQQMSHLSAPTKELRAMINGRRLATGGHKVLGWNISNAAMIVDSKENVMIARNKSTERIDGVAALIIAIGRALAHYDEGELTVGAIVV